jgi:hypothetical protein
VNLDFLVHLQWPAMVVTVAAAWLVGSSSEGRRRAGFWLFMISNVMWVAWGLHDGALALVALQFALAAMNVRGAYKASAEAQHMASNTPAIPVTPAIPPPHQKTRP